MPASLFMASSHESLWSGVLRKKLSDWKRTALNVPHSILMPSLGHHHWLKSMMLREGIGHLGIQFLTPTQIRKKLWDAKPRKQRLAGVVQLDLAMRAAAAAWHESLPARAIRRNPSAFLSALDALTASGIEPGEMWNSDLGAVADQFLQIIARSELCTIQQADALLFEESRQSTPEPGELLILGFDGFHWPAWRLLAAAARHYDTSIVTLRLPGQNAVDLDQIWNGSWEEWLSCAAEVVEAEDASPFLASLADAVVKGEIAADWPEDGKIKYRVGGDVREQAKGILRQALSFLCEAGCTRLGIVLPGKGLLARELSAQLQAAGIPHADALGLPVTDQEETERRLAIRFLKDRRIPSLAALWRNAPGLLQPTDISRQEAEKILQRCCEQLLLQEIDPILLHLSRSNEASHRTLARHLQCLPKLDATAPPCKSGALLEQFAESWNAAGLVSTARWVRGRQGLLGELADLTLSHVDLVDFLELSLDEPAREKPAMGSHPFARVQLLGYTEAEGQSWSHLILAGLNDDEWPLEPEESGFLDSDSIRKMNSHNVRQGGQGQGHLTVREGRALCLGSVERRALMQRQFIGLVEAPTEGLAVTASLGREGEPGRLLGPSSFLARLFFSDRGKPLDDKEWHALAEQHQNFCKTGEDQSAAPSDAVRETRRAWDARRAESIPFGPYEFALTQPPAHPLRLSCKNWEEAWQNPGPLFLKHLLHVESTPLPGEKEVSALTSGLWVHQWLKQTVQPGQGKDWIPFDAMQLKDASIREAARKTRDQVESLCHASGFQLPEHWIGVWRVTEWRTRRILQSLRSLNDWNQAAVEWTLPDLLMEKGIATGLRLHGRIDLVLAKGKGLHGGVWVIDYKTGDVKKLSLANLVQGKGLQVILYALCLEAMGAPQSAASLLSPVSGLQTPVVPGEIQGLDSLLHELVRMQELGCFGMRGEVRPEFGFRREFPIATLSLDGDLIREKWELTHPTRDEKQGEEE